MSAGQTELFVTEADEAPSDNHEDLAGAPLAARLRPRTLNEYIGQSHLVG